MRRSQCHRQESQKQEPQAGSPLSRLGEHLRNQPASRPGRRPQNELRCFRHGTTMVSPGTSETPCMSPFFTALV